MFHSIDQFLYDYRFVLLFLLVFPMLWSLWVFWSAYAAPAAPSTRSHSKRHSHRLRAQKQKQEQQDVTQTQQPATGAIALAESDQGNQSNLLDALAATEDEEDNVSDSEAFKYASTQKQIADKNSDSAIVNKLVGDVTDKVAAQIEALTGEPLDDQNVAVDMQDMLETVQEEGTDSYAKSVDQHDLAETVKEDSGQQEAVKPEGEHTAAIRKASKMEEIGFHRPSENDDEELEASVLNSPEIADLGAKHIARITELGLNEGVDPDKERMRTAQLDDILNRLDAALDQPDQEPKASASNTFSTASTQLLDAVDEDEISEQAETKTDAAAIPSAEVEPAAQVETAHSDAIDREALNQAVDDEADDFFGGLEEVSEEDNASAVNPDDVTVREESSDGESDGHQEAATMQADLSNEDPDESFNLADIAASIEENIDEQDQLDTVKLAQQESSSQRQAVDEQDGIETIAVPNQTDHIDPNLETLKEEDDADLPAWARADSFDEDLDDDEDKPKQQNLFD